MKRNKNITVYFLVKILSNGHVLEDSLHNQALYNNFPYCSRNKYSTGLSNGISVKVCGFDCPIASS